MLRDMAARWNVQTQGACQTTQFGARRTVSGQKHNSRITEKGKPGIQATARQIGKLNKGQSMQVWCAATCSLRRRDDRSGNKIFENTPRRDRPKGAPQLSGVVLI